MNLSVQMFLLISFTESHLSRALRQSEIQQMFNNTACFSTLPSQEGVMEGNVIVHERPNLRHVSIAFPLGRLPSAAVLVGVHHLYTHH